MSAPTRDWFADNERRARRHRPVEAGGQIIEHHGLLSGLEEGVNHVAADVAGAAGDQDRHVANPLRAITIVRPAAAKNPLERKCTSSCSAT
jgi:ribonuclease PH